MDALDKQYRQTWRTGVVALLLLAGCGGSGGSPAPGTPPGATPQRGDLVSSTSSPSIAATVVNAYISSLAGLGVDTSALNGKSTYQISLYRIVYKTITPDGRLIDASGVVAYPLRPAGASSPMLSYQHGTIFVDSDAPSNVTSANYDPVMVALAGSGFIVVVPDYIGYAASTNEIHTYIHAQGLAASIVDMLRAARRLLANNNVNTNGQLFLTGYSEGGYATLAAQKEMEQNLPTEFPVTASIPAAGPYDVSATMQHLVGAPANPFPEFIGFILKAYDHWYRWSRLNTIFQPPYDTVVSTYYDGSQNGSAAHDALNVNPTALFNMTFRNNFLGSDETTLKADVAKNDIHSWNSSTPTLFFHGEDDNVVPYFNATNAATAMTIAGSPAVTVENCTTPAPGNRGHGECFSDYLSLVIGRFVPQASGL